MRGTEFFHDAMESLLERRVRQYVGDGGNDLHLHFGFGHQRRPLRDLVDAFHQFVHAGQVAVTDRIAHARMGLHHVGGDAAGVEQGIMDAGVARHVLAHVVDADIHQLDRIERAAPEMRRGRGMRGAPGEDEIGARVGERRRHHDFPEA